MLCSCSSRLSSGIAVSLLCSLVATGCAGSAVKRSASAADLSPEDAEQIAEAYRHRHEARAANPNPLKNPHSLDEVLEVLRLDEIDLFPGAVKFATTEGSPRGKALAAQILVAWGDAQHLLGQLLSRAGMDLKMSRQRLERKQAAGKISPRDQERLDHVNKSLTDLEGVERALHMVGNRHIADGMKLAEQVIAAAPSDYEGYRVAADYYHLREEWPQFDEMVKKIETLKPNSNGLTFLRGEAARDRDHNRMEAAKLFKEAVTRDPKFTRAEVALLVLQSDLEGAHTELAKLKEINPNHQIVQWMGPTLERAYQDWKDAESHHEEQVDRAGN
jgi:hypothetical protein